MHFTAAWPLLVIMLPTFNYVLVTIKVTSIKK